MIKIQYDLFEKANLVLKCLIKCLTQAMIRDHHQMFQRICHHHLHILIKIKKSNQVFKKER
jgi:hypothetical protein